MAHQNLADPKRNEYTLPAGLPVLDELSSEQLRKAQLLHEGLTAALTARFSALLRQPIRVWLEKLERDDSVGCLTRIEEDSTLAVLTAGSQLRAAIFFGNSVLLSVIERMLGGTAGEHTSARPLTAVEVKLLEKLLVKVMPEFQVCWERAISDPVVLDEIHAKPEMATVFGSDEDLMTMACRIQLGFCESDMRIVLPVRSIVKMLDSGSGGQTASNHQEMDPVKQQIRETLLRSDVDVEVILSGNSLPLAALAKIKPGSLLVLDSKVDRQAEAVFNQSVRKKGQVLRDGTKRLFRIQDEKPSS
ncbi:MAG: FliM/FliN family flagellar motor switch protein [Acidobacteria bacterium]|nr:FliM/FliN family flagellar motor switch protein [Acidobacteriota bacterium]